MAYSNFYRNKNGEAVSLNIRVYRGEDEKGKALKPYQTSVKVPKGLSERQLEKFRQTQEVLFEQKCRTGLAVSDKILFRDFAKVFMETKRVAGKEKSTLARYQDMLDSRLLPYFGHMKMSSINNTMLNQFYSELQNPGQNKRTGGELSPKTILEHHRLLSAIFAEARKQRIILLNPAETASPPQVTRPTPNYFQPYGIKKIMAALDNEPIKWRALGYLFFTYGDRRSEYAGIKRTGIDFETHRLLLTGCVLYDPRNGVYEKPYPKNKRSRELPMTPEIEAVLKEYLSWLDSEKEKWGDQWIDSDYVFVGKHGGLQNPDVITKYFARMSERYQKNDPSFPHINPHAFRHTVVSMLLYKNLDITTVADYVGDDPATIAKHYAHIINAGKISAANTMSSFLTAPETDSTKTLQKSAALSTA